MNHFRNLLLFFFALSFSTVLSQENSDFEHTIQSEAFEKERRIRVFLPERYHRDSTATYAVTYVLDSQSDQIWNMVKGNIDYMVRNYTVMPMIIVGIVSDNRGSEFNPPSKKLRDHFRNEVFLLIESSYRVDDFRAVVGHSWGGAFVASTLFSEDRDLFDAYIGISPSFGDTDNVIVKDAARMLSDKVSFGKFLYLSHGDVGRREKEFAGYVASIDSLLKKYPNSSIAWKPSLVKNTDHWQIVVPSFSQGITAMSRNYFADQKVMEDLSRNTGEDLKLQVEEFNRKQKANFGYIHLPSARYLSFVGNDFRDLDDYQNALTLYKMALEKSPENVRTYVNLADTYDKMKNKESAIEAFKKTLQLLEAQKESLSENYYNGVSEWAKEKLQSYQ